MALVASNEHGLSVLLLGQCSNDVPGVGVVAQNTLKVPLTDGEDVHVCDCHYRPLHGGVVDQTLGSKVAPLRQNLPHTQVIFQDLCLGRYRIYAVRFLGCSQK